MAAGSGTGISTYEYMPIVRRIDDKKVGVVKGERDCKRVAYRLEGRACESLALCRTLLLAGALWG